MKILIKIVITNTNIHIGAYEMYQCGAHGRTKHPMNLRVETKLMLLCFRISTKQKIFSHNKYFHLNFSRFENFIWFDIQMPLVREDLQEKITASFV